MINHNDTLYWPKIGKKILFSFCLLTRLRILFCGAGADIKDFIHYVIFKISNFIFPSIYDNINAYSSFAYPKEPLENGLQNGDIYCFRPVTHVIFDMDGLLLNTQTMYSSVSARILAKHGKEPDFDFKVALIVDLAILSYRFQTLLQQNNSIILINNRHYDF